MLQSLFAACKILQQTQLGHANGPCSANLNLTKCVYLNDCWVGKKVKIKKKHAKSEPRSKVRPEVKGKDVQQAVLQYSAVDWENLLLKIFLVENEVLTYLYVNLNFLF